MSAGRRNVGAERQQRRDSLETDLEAVATASFRELRDIWRARLDEEPPTLRSREIYRRMLAYRLQAAVRGGLSPTARRKLDVLEAQRGEPAGRAAPAPVRLRPGSKLIREWRGVPQEVWVTTSGFMHQGRAYASLSEVARAITGTRWNGPLFFGLRDKMKEAA